MEYFGLILLIICIISFYLSAFYPGSSKWRNKRLLKKYVINGVYYDMSNNPFSTIDYYLITDIRSGNLNKKDKYVEYTKVNVDKVNGKITNILEGHFLHKRLECFAEMHPFCLTKNYNEYETDLQGILEISKHKEVKS